MEIANHITSVESIRQGGYSRFVSKEIDDNRIIPFIKESEQLDIKNQIGNTLFADILKYLNSEDQTSFADYKKLLDGGFYKYSTCNDSVNERYFNGLRETINYFVWARLVKNNPYSITRFGVVRKKDDNSENVKIEELDRLYLDTLAIAKDYLNSCILFLRNNRNKYPLFKKSYVKNGLNFKVIK